MNTESKLESDLKRHFITREERFMHGSCELSILLPRAADELLDEAEFENDERMPYWADLWPSAKALARWLLDQRELPARALELGCGVGLPSIALRWRGLNALATDYNEHALRFAQCNAMRNAIGELRTRLLDWRKVPADFGDFELVLAADVLYEQRNAITLSALLPQVVASGGRFVLADPGRHWAGEFRQRMHHQNWKERELGVVREKQAGAEVASTIRIAEWRSR